MPPGWAGTIEPGTGGGKPCIRGIVPEKLLDGQRLPFEVLGMASDELRQVPIQP